MLGGRECIKIRRIGGAIEAAAKWLQEANAREELTGVDKNAVIPAVTGVHVRDVQLRERRLVENWTKPPAIFELNQVQYGTDTLSVAVVARARRHKRQAASGIPLYSNR